MEDMKMERYFNELKVTHLNAINSTKFKDNMCLIGQFLLLEFFKIKTDFVYLL